MKRLQALCVTRVDREGSDAMRVCLDAPQATRDDFSFTAGQHLPLRAKIGGRTVQRTYSICSPPGVWPLVLGIRRQTGGRFSEWAWQELKVGDELLCLPPTGAFTANLERGARHRVAFAAGSGITPVLSILTDLLEDPSQQVTLFYANRSLASTMFIEELFALKNRHLGRLALHFIFSREPQGESIYEGRLDGDRIRELWRAFCVDGPGPVAEVFVCGPQAMTDTAVTTLTALGVDPTAIHIERFGSPPSAAPAQSPDHDRAEPSQDRSQPVEVALIMDGKQRQFAMDADGSTVLEGAERAGLELPYSCRGGVCATCRTHLREGSVEMAVNYGLEPWELERGFVLACQATPTSERLVLDYDLA